MTRVQAGLSQSFAEAGSRTRLLDLRVGLVENVRRDGTGRERSDEDFCHDFQVCLPYRGVFVWHVGGEDVVGDANQILFVTGGESYRMSGSLDGYAELIITPDLDVLCELAHASAARLGAHPLFRRRSWRAQPPVQSLRTRFLLWATGRAGADDLESEEAVLALLRSAIQDEGCLDIAPGAKTARLVRRSKEFLATEASNRILLIDVARAVGASPAYLTSLFRRVEGVSLYQYLTELRLARALAELPHCQDLTRLALDNGFSSHSHFSSSFRRAYGCTPSAFRERAKRRERPLPS